ncbi:hypothetical protein MOMA_03505 [Moraxella macacae 0408225]|uniref:Uncharacterized protein n=1 Tax=Moraxella macacae 0408225 TaxID=1230338 RepID=L2F8S0_9GAMM|nr:DUF6586 family protein [Moraxella macacae]ELA09437.1 hypothetical protein MOMA_03505 [Moraxella macacae 0408225]
MANRVARYQADRTNQKLYFCRIYCQLAQEAEQKQLADAHLESAILHLYGAYLAFLQEIACYYQLNLVIPTLTTIADKLAQKTQISPEIEYLTQLSEIDFLAEIEQAWQQVNFKPIPKQIDLPEKEADSKRLLLVNIMPDQSAVNPKLLNAIISVDMVRQWRVHLLGVIEALRAGMVED